MPPKREIINEYVEKDGNIIKINKTFHDLLTGRIRQEFETRFITEGGVYIRILDITNNKILCFFECMDKHGIKTRYPISNFG